MQRFNFHLRRMLIATIKDIAKVAGVAQGTVSNVLNGRGNVSSEKILKVQQAAASLGYTINERARMLRQGTTKTLAVVLPNFTHGPFVEFYLGFKKYTEDQGYSVSLNITEDEQQTELEIIQQMKSEMVAGLAVYTTFTENTNPYAESGFATDSVLFLERKPCFPCRYIGFDYHRCGAEMAERVFADGHRNCSLVTSLNFYDPCETDMLEAFHKHIKAKGGTIDHIRMHSRQVEQGIISLLQSANPPSAIILTRYGLAEKVKDICKCFFSNLDLSIYTASPIFTLPEKDFIKYELNYRLMGRIAAQKLISSKPAKSDESTVLPNYGFRAWEAPALLSHKKAESINILTLDSPEATSMKSVARLYTAQTGIDVNIAVYSYNEIHEILSYINAGSGFDILRLDVTLLSWFAEKILQPMDEVGNDITSIFDQYLDGLMDSYSAVNGRIYALPATPSVQLLYYRKDIFEDLVNRRVYHETFGTELLPPTTFAEFNQIARFFTNGSAPVCPVKYGASLTLGNSGVIGSEFLMRFFSFSKNLYDDNGLIRLDGSAGKQALELLLELHDILGGHNNSWWKDSAAEFAAGKSAMTILYSNFASDILAPESTVVSNVGVAPIPGGNPLIGGGSLGLSKFSKHPETAMHFIKWVCSEPAASAITLLGGSSPCKKTYENYKIIDSYPWLENAREGLKNIRGFRKPPESSAPFNEHKMLNILAMAIRNMLSNTFTVEMALSYIQKEFESSFTTHYK